MKFGLMFFAASVDAMEGAGYRLVVQSARFGDAHGFASVWVPERHFTPFGGLYPNPAVLQAALAQATERIHLRAGSVVAPLHQPLRIAEEWAMVDNLSGGRVGISFASGWNPDDFALAPERYEERHAAVDEVIERVRHLWRGGEVEVRNGCGQMRRLKIFPAPVQAELPVWVTAAGNPQTFAKAGRLGGHLLTHILDQDEEQLAAKIALYRQARAAAGYDPESGQVALMLHTFVGAEEQGARAAARQPFCDYIKNNIGLLKGLSASRGYDADPTSMGEEDLDEFVGFLYDRFAAERGLIGAPESCVELVERLGRIGVDEVACLLDFGPPTEAILANLPHLDRLRQLCAERGRERGAPRPPTAPVPAVDEKVVWRAGEVRGRCARQLTGAQVRALLQRRGLDVAAAAGVVERLWLGVEEGLGQLALGAEVGGSEGRTQLLDVCGLLLVALDAGGEFLCWPDGVRQVDLPERVPERLWAHARIAGGRGVGSYVGDVLFYDEQDRFVGEVVGLQLRPLELPPEAVADSSGLFYRRRWVPVDGGDSSARPGERWLLVGSGDGVGAVLGGLLEEAGAQYRVLEPGKELAAALADEVPTGVVLLAALEAPVVADGTLDDALAEGAGVALAVARALIDANVQTRLWVATRQGADLLPGENVDPAQAAVWGLVRALAVEHPDLWGGLVDLDPEEEVAARAAGLLAVLGGGEDMVAWRSGSPLAARLCRWEPLGEGAQPPLSLSPEDSYLIAGGLGGLGLELARYLATAGARHLALLGRSAPNATARQCLDELAAQGVQVRVIAADVAREEEVAAGLAEVAAQMPPLRGVFHLAGVLDDGLLRQRTWGDFARVGAAKVRGAWNLHRQTAALRLDYFVLFSSVASLVTMPGQGLYAAANAFLDALVQQRRRARLAAASINWGPWGRVGHAASEYGRRAHAQLAAMGIAELEPSSGMSLCARLLAADVPRTAVVRVDWEQLQSADPAAAETPLLREVMAASRPGEDVVETEFSTRLQELPAARRRAALIELLAGRLAGILRLPSADSIEPRHRLFDLGLDSIMALELKNVIERDLGRRLGVTLIFKYPTLEALTDHLLVEVCGVQGESEVAPTEGDLEGMSEEEMIALLERELEQ